ncbi:reverse transcriptase domain-containing protein [Ancylobacter sp. SL191]|uniref:reverse transcriptase domain-containing protein n=1 Tax=Ancylobacter sp. SL191 TaxID=2995166 RepID=UPI00226E5B80|nr:reverse transcriptase domain-containing protein [Ancylobacter sp. SL191]WAC28567.1 reverse transcriptase domain-containing protein [Ancylobacter sp. SL191]
MTTIPKELVSFSDFLAFTSTSAKELSFLSKYVSIKYKSFHVPKKKGGTRQLLCPDPRLKYLQRRILLLLNQIYTPLYPVHGFVKGRGIASNALQHQRKPYLLNIDLKDYFGTISRPRVRGALVAMGVEQSIADAICTICTISNKLPQGAPSSPTLSNIVTYKLDRSLTEFCKQHKIMYSRYADDISLSSYRIPSALFKLGDPPSGRLSIDQLSAEFLAILSQNGFSLNPEKLWLSKRRDRKLVTGLIVNKFVNIERKYIRNVRSSIFRVEKLGIDYANAEFQQRYKTHKNIHSVIRGRLEWISQIRGKNYEPYRRLAKRYNNLFPDKLEIEPTPVEIAENAVWVIEYFGENDCNQGTAFFLEGVGLVTADHVVSQASNADVLDIYRPNSSGKKYTASKTSIRCEHRDLIVLNHSIPESDQTHIPASTAPSIHEDSIIALGFPAFAPGDGMSTRRGQIRGKMTRSGVKLIEVSTTLDGGMSGGPILNERYQAIGVTHKGGGNEPKQIGVDISELINLCVEHKAAETT